MTTFDYSGEEYRLTPPMLRTIRALQRMRPVERRQRIKAMFRAKGSPPKSLFLYKYLGFDPSSALSIKKVRDLLVDGQLYLARPSEFNDPYDFSANVRITEDLVRRRKFFESSAKRAIELGYDPLPGQKMGKRKISAAASAAMAALKSNPASAREAFQRSRDRHGVSCFSRTARGQLMWGHYANSHTGLCLQFDAAECLGVLNFTFDVTYRTDLLSLVWPDDQEKVDQVIFSKSEEWMAEKEARYVSVDQPLRSIAFDAKATRGVILGARFAESATRIDALRQLLAERLSKHLPTPTIYQASPKPDRYGIAVHKSELF